MLSDNTIIALMREKALVIDPPPADSAIQPASVDLTLGRDFIDVSNDHLNGQLIQSRGEEVYFPAGACMLATTAETITLPDNIVARVEGKSTWGRKFLMVHSTAGFIDPGFSGTITLELKNLGPTALRLPIGGYIAQVSFQILDRPAARPYGHPELSSKYQGQTTVTAPR